MEYYSAVNKEEVLPFLTIWVNLEDIALSGIIQTETDKYRTISFIRGLKNKNIEKEIRCVVARDRVGRGCNWMKDEGGQEAQTRGRSVGKSWASCATWWLLLTLPCDTLESC